MTKAERPFEVEIKSALNIAKKNEDRVINIIGTNKLPIETMAYAIMLPPQTSKDPFSVYYLDNADPVITDHRILHELGHIVRFLRVSRQERLYCGHSNENINAASKDLLEEISGFLLTRGDPQEQFPEFLKGFYPHLINGLYNFPMDIRVEQWIHDTFPSVKTTQNSFLRQEVRNSEESLNDTSLDKLLPSISYRLKATVAARVFHIAILCEDTSILKPFANTEMIRLGEELVKLVLTPPDEGNRSDMSTVDNWAKKLNMIGWYQWVQHGESKEI